MNLATRRFLSFFVAAGLFAASPASGEGGIGAKDSFPYLYATRKDPDASKPVIDHIAPVGMKELTNQKPDFLYTDIDRYRIVNFCKSRRLSKDPVFRSILIFY